MFNEDIAAGIAFLKTTIRKAIWKRCLIGAFVLVVVWSLAMIHVAFQPEVARAELIGEYVANCGDGPDTLQLSPDGTYVHRWKEAGTWQSQSDKW